MQAGYQEPEIISQLAPLLQASVNDTSFEELEQLVYPLSLAIADQRQKLYLERKRMLWPKDVPMGKSPPTELDRTTDLNATVSQLERDLELLIKIEAQVNLRLLYLKER